MTKRKKPKRKVSEKIVKKLDIPEDIIFDIPRITLLVPKELRIENYKSILEYENCKITLSCKNILIEICGENLNISLITDEEIAICGNIASMNFSKIRS